MDKIVYIFLQDLSKRKHLFQRPAQFSYEKPMRWRTSRLMHDGISSGEILPKEAGYFGTGIN
jgi:hypothetical protein